ncbi:[pyruvate dehydrogenase (acetyl-transferring)] kinase [Malassezia psittaci]|uniref:[pyruvate dehydrogenase (Acetyl-transferring)] kinase n=1 Tax=Malassezia psittaci TaxID=1821823 RepID=A0AAF0JM31_9BASI|nr:[pyruvate dehydrogenase (acetyl-transferring)] kinase [Malassezia psittaci]
MAQDSGIEGRLAPRAMDPDRPSSRNGRSPVRDLPYDRRSRSRSPPPAHRERNAWGNRRNSFGNRWRNQRDNRDRDSRDARSSRPVDRGVRPWDHDARHDIPTAERSRPRPAPYHLDDPQESRPAPAAYTETRAVRSRPSTERLSSQKESTSSSIADHPAKPTTRPELQLPVKVRQGPRPGTLARQQRKRPAPLAQRTFQGCSPLDAYQVTVKLGQGTFGEVKQAKQIATGRDVALKRVTIHDVKDGMPITALREIKLLKTLHHPYIVPVIDMAFQPAAERGKMGDVFMVEPYMDHDLNGLLDNPTIQLQMNQIKLYMRQLLEGTLYMHQNKILHRDMKAANLLIDNHGQLQIADFGLARPYYDPGQAWRARGWKGGVVNYTDMVVTRWYRPPELLAGQRNYGPPVDMWGIGCILAEMVTGKPLFKGASEINQLELIASLCGSPNDENFPGWSKLPGVKNATASGRPDLNPNVQARHDFGRHPRVVRQHFTTVVDVGRECADLIDKLLVLDPCKRLTAAEALEHEWFWTKPYPADPASLPKYVPSKEIDRVKRDHHPQPHNGRVPMPMPPQAAMPVPISARSAARPAPPISNATTGAYPPMPRLPMSTNSGGNRPNRFPRGRDQGWYDPSSTASGTNYRPPMPPKYY